MVVLEEFPGEGDDLAIGWMIKRFDALDLGFERRGVLSDMVYEHGFFIGGSGHENGSGITKRCRYALEISPIFRRVAAADRIRLVMDVSNGVLWADDDFIRFRRIEMEEACFVVINPNDGVKMI